MLLSAGFLLFLALANVAIWFPRFDAIAASSLGDGYRALEGTLARGAGELDRPIADDGIWAGWPLGLASTPGAYVGAVILLCVPFAFRDAARRYLVGAFVAFAGLSYLLTLTLVVRAGWFRSVVLALPFGDVYLHNPGRLRFVAYLVVPALGALGIQWLLDVRPSFADAVRWIAGGLLVLLLLPVLGGAHPERLVIFALAAGAADRRGPGARPGHGVGRRSRSAASSRSSCSPAHCGRRPTKAEPRSPASREPTGCCSPARSAGRTST